MLNFTYQYTTSQLQQNKQTHKLSNFYKETLPKQYQALQYSTTAICTQLYNNSTKSNITISPHNSTRPYIYTLQYLTPQLLYHYMIKSH